MEELKLNCDASPRDFIQFRDVGCAAYVGIDCDDESASVMLSKKSASQLHEWLGRYLENSNEN